jgi:hypothetical protein
MLVGFATLNPTYDHPATTAISPFAFLVFTVILTSCPGAVRNSINRPTGTAIIMGKKGRLFTPAAMN